MGNNLYYKFFTCCFIIESYTKNTVIDFQRKLFWSFSKEYSISLDKFKNGVSIEGILLNENKSLINFLKQEELIFETETPEKFPLYKNKIDFKSQINDSIIIVSKNNLKHWLNKENIEKIDSLFVRAIYIHFEQEILNDVKTVLNAFQTSVIQSIELSLDAELEKAIDYKEIIDEYPRISNIYVHNSSFNNTKQLGGSVFLVLNKMKFNLHNQLTKDYLRINRDLIIESQLHHTYFNRKLYIGPNGEIKNAPECEENFGKIQDLKNEEELKEIITTQEFQKYWYVHKEITDVCKECEFRHMCVDNRLPYKRKENEWYHKQECNYNPYISKWQGEEGYKTLAECGVVSNEKEFSINHDKIAEINEELWGDPIP